ncbi:hypothetical protein M407DRAFT_4233 [Tulasnella calospora MUT 4182]|uniref:Uncharacterized protein n=1 Tax=Tulasnella calospora MUT 4182 TaxID=1051891 RepID=A0A0C3QW22_9AGAM|nr:hypothetical protein M407DRAFT_4233 [Tulasnella calospora MUT 4182]
MRAISAPEYADAPDNISPEEDGKEAKRQYQRQATSCRAALWLLEMASNREDQLIAVRFLYTVRIPREVWASVIINSEQLQLLISLTLEAFAFWRSQPTEKTQETVEHFGRALCHVLSQSPETTERWKELNPLRENGRSGLGERFLLELSSSQQTPSVPDPVGGEYTLQYAMLRTLILMKDIPIESHRWTNLKFIIKKEGQDSQVLGLWARLVYQRFGHSEKHPLLQFAPLSPVVSKKQGESPISDFPLALVCGVSTLKAVERQAAPNDVASMVLDAIEIYNVCVQKTEQLVKDKKLLPPLPKLVANAMIKMMTLATDGFLGSVAAVILNFDQVEDGNPVKRRDLQCRLTRAFLSVWRHCSTIPDIEWPMEKMLAVINSASSATELLLGRYAAPISREARAAQNTTLNQDALFDTQNRLKQLLDWTNERLSKSTFIGSETTQAISMQLTQQMDGESPPC